MQRSASCANASLGVEVVDVTGRDEREAGLVGERDEVRVDLLLLREPGVLQLDVRRVAPEDLHEAVEILARVLRPRPSESARDTRPERQPESATMPFAWRSSSSQSTRGL